MITEKTNVWRSGLSSLAKSLARVLPGSGPKKQSGSSGTYLAAFSAFATLSLLFTPNTTLAQDAALRVSFDASSDTEAIENGADAMVTVTLDQPADRTVTIPITTSPAKGDFALSFTHVSFAVGEDSRTIAVSANNDDNTVDERVTLSFGTLPTGVSRGSPSSAVVTLRDDDLKPLVISFAENVTYNAREGGADARVMITVNTRNDDNTLTRTTTDRALRINITEAAGTDTEAEDWELSGVDESNNLVIAAGQSSQTVTVKAKADDDNDNESVILGFGATLPAEVTADEVVSTTVNLLDNGYTTVSFSADKYEVTEVDGSTATVDVAVNIAPPPDNPQNVRVTFSPAAKADGTGPYTVQVGGTDFSSGSMLTVPAAGSATITVTANDDDDLADHTIRFSLSNFPSGTRAGEHTSATVTVMDDDTPDASVVQFGAPVTSTVSEGGTRNVRIEISPAPSEDVKVGIAAAVTGDNADPGDIKLSEEEVTFTAGQRAKTITVTANADADITNESVALSLTVNEGEATVGTDRPTHTMTITDDGKHIVTLTSSGTEVVEGGTGGTEVVTLTVTLAPAIATGSTQTIGIPISVSPSSGDFTLGGADLVNNRVTFAAGEATKEFTVTAKADDDSDDEEVTFTVRPPSLVKAGDPVTQKVALIDATRPTLTFGASSYLATENGDPATVTVTLDPPSPKEVTVPITATPDTAPYLLSADQLVFPAGVGSQTITVVAEADDDTESSSVTLGFGTPTPANARVAADAGVHQTTAVTLADDGQRTVIFSAFSEGTTYTAMEGGTGGAETATVTVTLSSALTTGSAAVPITVMPASGDFTLQDGFDGTLTFDSTTGASLTFTITAKDDDDHDNETIALGFGSLPLSLRAGSQSTATVTITDDEAAPTTEEAIVSFGAVTYTAVENGDDATVEITLDRQLDDDVEIAITASGDTDSAKLSADKVTFTAGETRQMITVTAVADADDPPANNSVTLTLDASDEKKAAGVTTAGGQVSATVTLVDDGVVKGSVTFAANMYTVSEDGTSGTVTIDLTRGSTTDRDISIPIITKPASGDFILSPPDMVTFPTGVNQATIEVTITDDPDVETDDMKVDLELGALPADFIAGANAKTTLTLADDDRAAYEVTIVAADTNIDEDGGKTDLTITLSAEPDRDLTIPISVDDTSTAEEGDYTLSATEVVYRKGDKGGKLAQKITLTAVNDNSINAGLTVVVGFDDLPGGVTATSGSETATVTIDDDDVERTINFGMDEYAAVEGGADAMIVVTLDAAAGRDITLPITTDPKSGPFELSPTELVFGEKDTTKTITVTATEDFDGEDATVELSFAAKDRTAMGIAATGTTDTATVTLVDDRNVMGTVSFGAATYEAMEGGDAATVMVNLDPPLPSGSRKTYEIPVSGWPMAGASPDNFELSATSVTFGPGESSKMITVTAVDNDVPMTNNGAVKLIFGAMPGDALPEGIVAGDPTETTVTLVDDDRNEAIVAYFMPPSGPAVEGGDAATVAVGLSLGEGEETLDRDITLPITVSHSEGAEGDYTVDGHMNVTFASGTAAAELWATITVTANLDDDNDNETVTLGLGALSPGVTAGSTAEQPATAEVTLMDDGLLALTVSLDAAEYTAAEGGDAATVTVSLSAESDREITIPITATPAEGSEDAYEVSAESVVFAAGDMEQTITVTASYDDDTEDDSVTLSLGDLPSHVAAGDTTSATVSLTDDGLVPLMVTFDAAEYSADEGGDAVTVMVNLNRETDREVTFQINTDPAEGDFEISATEVAFAVGDMSKEITISASLDDDTEDDTVMLSFGDLPERVQGGENTSATVTLTDDGLLPLTVAFAAATYTANEGGDAMNVTVRLNVASDREITIPITMDPADGPYELSVSEVTFSEGQQGQNITVTATLDDDLEDAVVTLGFGDLPERVTAGEQSITVVTLSDDMLLPLTVSFGAAEYSATEGGAAATVMVSLSAASDRGLIIPINTDPASGDFEVSADQVTFAAGDMHQEITVTATLDDDTENDMVTLSLGALPNRVTEGANTSTAVTLVDDGLVPLVVSFDAAEYEAHEGGEHASIWVNLNVASDRNVTIPVAANPATGDFEVSATEVTFAAGEMSKEITVMAMLDDDVEDDSVTLTIGALPNRVTAGANTTAMVTLVDDGLVPVTVSFAADAYTATEGGAAATVTVNLDQDPNRDVTVPITTDPAEGDFELSANEVTFSAGNMSQTITVTATSDTDVDDEMVMLGLGALPNRVYLGEPSTSAVSLIDKGYTVTFDVARQTVRESERGTVTASISPAANGSVSVPLSVTHQGGASAADYSGVPGSLSFSGGQSSTSFTVSVMADEENDPGESIDVSFGSLPDKVNAGDMTMTTVEFEQFRTPEQFSRTLQAALAVIAGAMGDSAINAIEGRFERYRESMMGMSAAAETFERTYGHWNDMESPGMAMTGHQGYTGMDNGFVPMATTNPGTGLTAGSTGYGRSHTSGSMEEAISLGALASTARPGEAVIASGYGMAPNGQQDVNFSGVAFEMAMEHGDEGKFSPVVWVQGDLQRFDGEIEDIGMDFDGGLDAIHLGVDLYANGQTLAGVSLMQSWGDLDYTDDGVDGSLDSSMSTFHPYVYFQANPNLGVWGILGFGSGSVDVSEPDRTHEFDADFSMFAGGVRSVLNRRDNNELGLSADAFMAELSTDAADDISGVSGEAQRARVMVDWLSNSTMEAGQDFSWKAEIGGRFDGGDGIEGAGIEAGFRAGLVDSDQGLDVAIGARALLLHENDASDYGIGVQVTWDPGEQRKGMVASLGSSYGQDRGGSTSLWDNGNAMNPIGTMWQETQVRVDGEIGYAGILTPFGLPGTVMPYSRARFSGYGQEFGVGTRWTPAETSSTDNLLPATFELEGLTRETRSGLSDLALVLRMSIPFGGEKAIEPRNTRNRAVNEAAMGPTVSTAYPETETTGAE